MGVTLRVGPRPGDLGTVLEMHGRVYAAEYQWDEEFEAHVASGLARFAAHLAACRHRTDSSTPGWLWVAEDGDRPVGTVALTDEGDGVGQLRWFLVEPSARGGVGRQLLGRLLDHARATGFGKVVLWTVDGLDGAARLYREAGFVRTEEVPGHRFGHDLVEVRYDLAL